MNRYCRMWPWTGTLLKHFGNFHCYILLLNWTELTCMVISLLSGTHCRIVVDRSNFSALWSIIYKLNCFTLLTVNMHTQPTSLPLSPLISLQSTTLDNCILIDWLIDWLCWLAAAAAEQIGGWHEWFWSWGNGWHVGRWKGRSKGCT